MRVLFLNSSGQLGGAEVSLLDVMASLRTTVPTWQLRLIVGESGPLADRARSLGVEAEIQEFVPNLARIGDAGWHGPAGKQVRADQLFLQLIGSLPSATAYVIRLRATIRRMRPDIIHGNSFKMHLLGSWAAPKNIPVIWHLHDYLGARLVMKHALRMNSRRCAAVVANSRSTAKDASHALPGVKAHTVLNGVNLNRFTPRGVALDLDKLSGLCPASRETVRVGLVATLARWKGHEVFLRAIAQLPANIPVRGYIIGDALYRSTGSQHRLDDLRTAASGLGLDGRVGFTGFLDEPAAAMRALDVIVHASTQPEPFGLAIAEGLACGRPVVVADAGGARELLMLGGGAMGHEPGDSAALARCIARLATDSALRIDMGSQGRRTAELHLDRSRLSRQFVPIYQSLRRTPPVVAREWEAEMGR